MYQEIFTCLSYIIVIDILFHSNKLLFNCVSHIFFAICHHEQIYPVENIPCANSSTFEPGCLSRRVRRSASWRGTVRCANHRTCGLCKFASGVCRSLPPIWQLIWSSQFGKVVQGSGDVGSSDSANRRPGSMCDVSELAGAKQGMREWKFPDRFF